MSLLGGFLLLALAGLLSFFQLDGEEEPSPEEELRGVRAQMQDVTLVRGQEGSVLWSLQASRAELGPERELIHLGDPRLEYPDEEGHLLQLSSSEGRYDREQEKAEFWPRVLGSYRDLRFSADRMEYIAGEGRIKLEGDVWVRRGNRTSIHSESALLEPEDERVVFSRGAEVNLYGNP